MPGGCGVQGGDHRIAVAERRGRRGGHPLRAARSQCQHHADEVQRDDDHVGTRHAQARHEAGSGEGTADACRVLRRARDPHRRHQLRSWNGGTDQGRAQTDVRRLDQPDEKGHGQDAGGTQLAACDQHKDHPGQQRRSSFAWPSARAAGLAGHPPCPAPATAACPRTSGRRRVSAAPPSRTQPARTTPGSTSPSPAPTPCTGRPATGSGSCACRRAPARACAPSSAQGRLAMSARTEPGRGRSCRPLVTSRWALSQGRDVLPVHAHIVGRSSHTRFDAVNHVCAAKR